MMLRSGTIQGLKDAAGMSCIRLRTLAKATFHGLRVVVMDCTAGPGDARVCLLRPLSNKNLGVLFFCCDHECIVELSVVVSIYPIS